MGTVKPIKALSLYQPWATLVACGEKRMETRSWHPGSRLRPGEELAIHASTTFSADDRELAATPPFRTALLRHGIESTSQLPLGVVVAVCRFRDAVMTHGINYDAMSDQEYAFGNYEPGRWVWFLDDAQPIVPVPAKGMQQIWGWTPPPGGYVLLEPGASAAHARHAQPLSTPKGTNIPAAAARGIDGPHSAPHAAPGMPARATTHLHTWGQGIGGRYAPCTGLVAGKRCKAIMDLVTQRVAEGR